MQPLVAVPSRLLGEIAPTQLLRQLDTDRRALIRQRPGRPFRARPITTPRADPQSDHIGRRQQARTLDAIQLLGNLIEKSGTQSRQG